MDLSIIIILTGICAFIGPILWWMFVSPHLEMRKWIAQGRVISWPEALQRIHSGNGFFVFHFHVPYWLEGEVIDDENTLDLAIKARGILVHPLPRPADEIQDLLEKEAPGKFRKLDCFILRD